MTTATLNLATLPLDRLKRLAKEAPDAVTRAAAARALEARQASHQPHDLGAKIEVVTTEYGTPQPELVLTTEPPTQARELRALLLELAAQAERRLLLTPEQWEISVRHDGHYRGAVVVELMDGSAAEVDRARALLATLGRLTPGKKRSRKRAKSSNGTGKKPDAKRTNGATATA